MFCDDEVNGEVFCGCVFRHALFDLLVVCVCVCVCVCVKTWLIDKSSLCVFQYDPI